LCLEEDNEANSDLDCYSLKNLQDLKRLFWWGFNFVTA
jgi:hypothetical protein